MVLFSHRKGKRKELKKELLKKSDLLESERRRFQCTNWQRHRAHIAAAVVNKGNKEESSRFLDTDGEEQNRLQ